MVKKIINTIVLFFLCNLLIAQKVDLLPTSTTNEIIYHQYYTLSFSDSNKQAEWVAYLLVKPMISGKSVRKNNFRIDPSVKTGSATPSDYIKSGYDKGHLCPADDMTFNDTAMSETFYMSNMSPQLPSFNRGIWKSLETLVRSWAFNGDSIYIVTGGILKDNKGVIGANKVAVPKSYYKIVYDITKPQKMIAFILPNDVGTKPLQNYTVTVDSVQKVTNIDFFHNLPDTLQKRLEGKININSWSF